MREYGGDMHFICLETQTLVKKRFSYEVLSLSHGHCLATIAFILDIYLWWHVLWRVNHNYMEPYNDFPLPCRSSKNQSFQDRTFRSGDISVRLRNLAEILRVNISMQTYLNQREVLFKKNCKHDPRSNS